MTTKTSEFLNNVEKYAADFFSRKRCFDYGVNPGERKIDRPQFFPTADESQETRINNTQLPVWTMYWRNRSRPDNYTQRIYREGDLTIRVYALNIDKNLAITRDYLQNAIDVFMLALTGHTYRKIIGNVGKINVLTQQNVVIPNRSEISGKEITMRIVLS